MDPLTVEPVSNDAESTPSDAPAPPPPVHAETAPTDSLWPSIPPVNATASDSVVLDASGGHSPIGGWLRSAGRFGARITAYVAGTLLFAVGNLALIVYAGIQIFGAPESVSVGARAGWFTAACVVGLGVTALMAFLAYGAFFLDMARIVYRRSAPLVGLFCRSTADRAVEQWSRERERESFAWEKTVHTQEFIATHFARMPWLIRKAASFLFDQIPFARILPTMGDAVEAGDRPRAATVLHREIDAFVHEYFLDHYTLTIMACAAPVNVALMLIFAFAPTWGIPPVIPEPLVP